MVKQKKNGKVGDKAWQTIYNIWALHSQLSSNTTCPGAVCSFCSGSPPGKGAPSGAVIKSCGALTWQKGIH